ncbi:MAG TPA: MFS transporter, partial [Deinococcales bacterium]|nr:MFS transporter [Deinococcales bacterium]
YGVQPVMGVSVWVFAVGLLPTLFTTNPAFIACIVPVAFAAVVLMTLPYTILMGLLPNQNGHGAGAGLFELSRGVGVIVGPLLAGFATAVLDNVGGLSFADTDGYSAIFGVSSLLLILSIPFLRRAHSDGWRAPAVT